MAATTSARRKGMVNSTPRMPPETQIRNDIQKGNSVHQPMITNPGSTKMMDAIAPAADATIRPIRKLMAANRSEIAVRIFRAGTELSMRTVAVFAHEDRLCIHRYKADEAYQVGAGKGNRRLQPEQPVRRELAGDLLRDGAAFVHAA